MPHLVRHDVSGNSRLSGGIGKGREGFNKDAAVALEDAEVAQGREQALLDVAKGTLDRARANADLVQKASAALVPLYTGALALAFSVGDHPLPLRGLIPTILLGLAVVAPA